MTTRLAAPLGAPCWLDLWTSDVEASRRFYCELFGWRAETPNPDYGGYFMFTREGVPIAGAMGDRGELRATDSWKPYFSTLDIDRALELATSHGAEVLLPAGPVGDLGSQAVITDAAGAVTGIWQPGSFFGFSAIHEPGTPSFIAIDVHDYRSEIAFYRLVFGWDPLEEEVDGHHYAGFVDPDGQRPLAGIGDEVESLAPGETPFWTIFWQVDDVDASVSNALALGGAVLAEPDAGGLGRVARVADPSGARFSLFTPMG